MKLLHVVPTYLPARRYGGPILSVHGLCKALVARGHQVDVFTTNVDGPGTLDVPVSAPVDLDGVRVWYYRSPFARLYWSPEMAKALRSRAGHYDVLHSHAIYLWPGVASSRAARSAAVPLVISPRGMLVPELIRARNRLVKTLWLSLMERPAFSRASAVHFTSQLELDEARRVGLPLPSPFIVPNGIDLEERPAVTRDQSTILSIGRISWKKDLHTVIEALPRIPGARFRIAGNDEENLTPRLRELAERLGVGDRVAFVGPVYGEAKNDYLARAALFVLPSRSENFGNVVLEALAMGTPVVLSAGVGLADEVVKAGAGIVGLEGLGELLGDAPRRAEMGRRGQALVAARFTWPRVAEEMERQYRRLVSG